MPRRRPFWHTWACNLGGTLRFTSQSMKAQTSSGHWATHADVARRHRKSGNAGAERPAAARIYRARLINRTWLYMKATLAGYE